MSQDPLELSSIFPGPRRPGDKVRLPTQDIDTVTGVVLQRRRSTNGALSYADEVLFDDDQSLDVDIVDTCTIVDSVDPPQRPTTYPVSNALHHTLKTIIEEPGHGLAWQIMKNAHDRLGYQMYVVGGAVRDLVSGQATSAEGINDLDITGDMPAGLFADLAKISAFRSDAHPGSDSKRAQRQQVVDIWVPHVTVSASGVVHCYRLDSDADRSKKPKEDHFLEYAPLKHAHARYGNLGQTDEFIFGWDLKNDYLWRDMSINCLLYDPFKGEILDPGNFLADFCGLTALDILHWEPEEVKQPTVTLRPIPLPENPTLFWTAKAVARMIKSVDKYKDANLGPCIDWITRFTTQVQKVPARGKSPASESLQQNLRAQFHIDAKEGDFGEKKIRIKDATTHLCEAGAPQWFHDLVMEAVGGEPDASRLLGSGKGIWPKNGINAYRLVPISTLDGESVYQLGLSLPQLADEADEAYEHWAWTTAGYSIEGVLIVDGADMEPFRAYAFVDGNDRIVPVDGNGNIVSFNVEGDLLTSLHEGDLAQLIDLFPQDSSGRVRTRHQVDPDGEAPSDEDWPPEWPKPSVRSKPNPREYHLNDDEKTPAMKLVEVLQRMRNAGLVQVCKPDNDLFWACMNEGSVELTPLGRYYRSQMAPGEPSI